MYSVNGQGNREHKLKTGLLIGRFQPFHKGHDYLIKKALGQVDKLIIAIGSSNVKDTDNPFTYPQRKKILEIYIENEDMENKIVKIFPLPDNPSDDVWVRNAVKKAGRIDVIISNNELNVNRFFQKEHLRRQENKGFGKTRETMGQKSSKRFGPRDSKIAGLEHVMIFLNILLMLNTGIFFAFPLVFVVAFLYLLRLLNKTETKIILRDW